MDQTEQRNRFFLARDRYFCSDLSRRMILVVGTGLHHHLNNQGVLYPNNGSIRLRNWNALLSDARIDYDNNIK